MLLTVESQQARQLRQLAGFELEAEQVNPDPPVSGVCTVLVGMPEVWGAGPSMRGADTRITKFGGRD